MQDILIDTVRNKFARSDASLWALVIGDLMLDRYLIGEVERISPEAPVPVVLLKQQNERAGGAANVAANLAKLGIKTRLAGLLGKDSEGGTLLRLIAEMKIATQGIVQSQSRQTITKTRILGGHQQMLRLDQESRAAFDGESKQLQQASGSNWLNAPPLLFSDYAKGVLSASLCAEVIDYAKTNNIPVLVDPKGMDYSKYKGATALTPTSVKRPKPAALTCVITKT